MGSSWIQSLLWPYFREKEGYHKALGDAFILRNWMYDTGTDIDYFRTGMTEQQARNMPIDRTFEYERRFELLRKYVHRNGRYFMKIDSRVWTANLSQESWTNLHVGYKPIIVERRDKREVALSHAIALNSNFYAMRSDDESTSQKFVKGPLTGDMAHIIADDLFAFYDAKKLIMDSPLEYIHIEYEDVLEEPDYIKRYVFTDYDDYVEDFESPFYRIANFIDKDAYITNIDYFNEWFESMEKTYDAFASNR
jgi:hypothetical protein